MMDTWKCPSRILCRNSNYRYWCYFKTRSRDLVLADCCSCFVSLPSSGACWNPASVISLSQIPGSCKGPSMSSYFAQEMRECLYIACIVELFVVCWHWLESGWDRIRGWQFISQDIGQSPQRVSVLKRCFCFGCWRDVSLSFSVRDVTVYVAQRERWTRAKVVLKKTKPYIYCQIFHLVSLIFQGANFSILYLFQTTVATVTVMKRHRNVTMTFTLTRWRSMFEPICGEKVTWCPSIMLTCEMDVHTTNTQSKFGLNSQKCKIW